MSLAHKTTDELVVVQFGGVEPDATIARDILQSRREERAIRLVQEQRALAEAQATIAKAHDRATVDEGKL